MPRLPRLKSESGIYHIMLRGINQQVIFEDGEDYSKFIDTLKKYKTISKIKETSIEELSEIIPLTIAQNLKEFLNNIK